IDADYARCSGRISSASRNAVSGVMPRRPRTISFMRVAGTWSMVDRALTLIPSGARYSSRRISPGWIGRIPLISCRQWRILNRNPPIAGFLLLDMPDAGERQMRTPDPEFLFRGTGKNFLACGNGLFFIGIEIERHGRICKLHCMAMDDVAPYQQLLSLGRKHIPFMAGCMACQWNRCHAVGQSVACHKLLQLPGSLIGCHGLLGCLEKRLCFFWRLCGRFLVQPIIGFA